ncbi:hypothetical protein M8812_002280 [Salmonella enterica subsp. enterica serovar Bareilly]|jgi:hypothetical protein|nr:hypothetical protein [Salmonella enterica subsp. enterica serovar Bareilly]MLM11410.1 hypothetical protein [Salmonella enterica subsp. enterica serovar Bareilly]
MWLSAIHRDLPKQEMVFTVGEPATVVGVAKFERVEEGQFVVVDDNENEFMLFHPEVDTSEICEGSLLLSWQNPETGAWMWCVAKPTNEAGTAYVFGETYVEPKPH